MEIEVNNNRISLHDFLMFQAQYNIKLKEKGKEIERLKNIIKECSEDILKELEDNNHLSYGVALGIIYKLNSYKQLKDSDNE